MTPAKPNFAQGTLCLQLSGANKYLTLPAGGERLELNYDGASACAVRWAVKPDASNIPAAALPVEGTPQGCVVLLPGHSKVYSRGKADQLAAIGPAGSVLYVTIISEGV